MGLDRFFFYSLDIKEPEVCSYMSAKAFTEILDWWGNQTRPLAAWLLQNGCLRDLAASPAM